MPKLPNAPLKEVIFEVRWPLLDSDQGFMIDEGFELASGRLSSLVEKKFPVNRRVKPAELPEQFLPYQVIHQYWTDEETWPVLQLGPGIFTINYTDKAYEWDELRNLINDGVKWLSKAYQNELNINFASLNYIDIIKVEKYGGVGDDWGSFIEKHFNMSHHNRFPVHGKQKHLQINQVFEMKDGSHIHIQFSDGSKNNKKAFVWQTGVLKKCDFSFDGLLSWADFAHQTTHDLFMEMIKPELYASFEDKS
jgi:uncharacterized protein (TIGR04255 family)